MAKSTKKSTAELAIEAKANVSDIISLAIEGTMIATKPTAFTDARQALVRISAREQKSLEDWLIFGKTWCHVRRLTNGNKQVMKQIREALFSDKEGRVMVSAEDSSYAALMATSWYDVEYYATEISPHCANPRTVMKGYKAWQDLRDNWGIDYVDAVFITGGIQKAAIQKAAKAIGSEQEVLAIRAAAIAAKNRANKAGSTISIEAIAEAAKKAEKKVGKKNKKAKETAKKAGGTKLKKGNGETPSPKKLTAHAALLQLQAVQPTLIAAINTGELHGDALDELDRQVAAIKRAIVQYHENAPTVTVKKAVNS